MINTVPDPYLNANISYKIPSPVHNQTINHVNSRSTINRASTNRGTSKRKFINITTSNVDNNKKNTQ